jgi:hypothetical protein
MTLLNKKEIAQFQKLRLAEMEKLVRKFPYTASTREAFVWSQKIQRKAIQIFEASKGSIPRKWFDEQDES